MIFILALSLACLAICVLLYYLSRRKKGTAPLSSNFEPKDDLFLYPQLKLLSELEESMRIAKSLEESLFASLVLRGREFGGNISPENYKDEISAIVKEAKEQNRKKIKAISDIEYRNHQSKKELLGNLEDLATVVSGLELTASLDVNATVLKNWKDNYITHNKKAKEWQHRKVLILEDETIEGVRRRYESLGNLIKSNPYVSEKKYFNLDQIALDTKFAETAEHLTLIKEHELRLEGQISTHFDRDSVAEYEEELELTQEQVRKLEALDEIFKKTSDYLAQASRKMHREIAPKIERELCSKASIITSGKYDNFQISLDDLTVMIKINGSYRKVSSLSHGTQEQMYLILRLVLIGYLNNTGEPCPIFLDDITVHSDSQRKKDILDLIHELSKTRQIILFSQEEYVKEWSRLNLKGNDKFLTL